MSVSGLMIRLTLDDLIEKSDTVVVGEVVDILPSRRVDWEPWDKMIITDVVIEVEHYLYGQPQSPYIAVVVRGGRVGEMGMWVEDEPITDTPITPSEPIPPSPEHSPPGQHGEPRGGAVVHGIEAAEGGRIVVEGPGHRSSSSSSSSSPKSS